MTRVAAPRDIILLRINSNVDLQSAVGLYQGLTDYSGQKALKLNYLTI